MAIWGASTNTDHSRARQGRSPGSAPLQCSLQWQRPVAWALPGLPKAVAQESEYFCNGDLMTTAEEWTVREATFWSAKGISCWLQEVHTSMYVPTYAQMVRVIPACAQSTGSPRLSASPQRSCGCPARGPAVCMHRLPGPGSSGPMLRFAPCCLVKVTDVGPGVVHYVAHRAPFCHLSSVMAMLKEPVLGD